MVCNFLVSVTLMLTGPTPKNTQGVLKVEQYQYSEYVQANRHVRDSLMSMAHGLATKKYPSVIGVEIIKVNDFKCNYEGEQL